MSLFHIILEAKNPVRNAQRRYEVVAGQDLFGYWLVEVTFGRIGCSGRALRHAWPDEELARAFVRNCLRRRQSAPRRIEVCYRVKHCEDPRDWLVVSG